MANGTKFRVQAGSLVFEIEGEPDFVRQQVEKHRDRIDLILDEQAKLIRTGKIPTVRGVRGRRGRPPKAAGRPKSAGKTAESGRRPGRQPVIIRESDLQLKPRQLSGLQKYLTGLAGDNKLGKDAVVFAIAYYLTTEVLRSNTFTAGDVSVAYEQVGKLSFAPPPNSVDVVQMLRNLAAASIGKEWVERQADGTFQITDKGKKVGESGQIVRPRGRRPGESPKKTAKRGPGRPPGRPKGRPPGRPPGRPKGALKSGPKARRGRKPKNA